MKIGVFMFVGCAILLCIFIFVFSIYMDARSQPPKKYRKFMPDNFYDEQDEQDNAYSKFDLREKNKSDFELYGGVQMGDTTVHFTDDDDLIDEFGDDVL